MWPEEAPVEAPSTHLDSLDSPITPTMLLDLQVRGTGIKVQAECLTADFNGRDIVCGHVNSRRQRTATLATYSSRTDPPELQRPCQGWWSVRSGSCRRGGSVGR